MRRGAWSSRGRRLSVATFAVATITAGLALAVGREPDAPSASQFVRRNDNRLVLRAAAYTFTGLNVYNVNSRSTCSYNFGGTRLSESLRTMGSGKEAVRAWFFQRFVTIGGSRDWTVFDESLAAARRHGVRVIATLSNQWNDCDDGYGYKTASWYRGGYTKRDPLGTQSYRDYVVEIARRYRNDPTILAWQLINEAQVTEGGECVENAELILRTWAADVSSAIKHVDPNHLVSIGTIGSGQCGTAGEQYAYVHDLPSVDLCEYHDYGSPRDPMPGDRWNGLRLRLQQCRALGKPLFIGESGIMRDEFGTLTGRADAFHAKLGAQFAAGVVGVLAWDWRDGSGPAADGYEIGPGDPALRVLGGH